MMSRHAFFGCAAIGVLAAVAACQSTQTITSGGPSTTDPSLPPAACIATSTPNADGGVQQAEPIRCAGGDAAAVSDCPAGYHCNTALGPPVCQKLYCGTPGSVCAETELCQQGLQCFDGKCDACTVCGDQCAVDFATDPKNCGACGNVVPEGRTCVAGVPTCDAPMVECDGECIDPKKDARHCGGCNEPVGPGAVCVNGAPECGTGTISCNSKCVSSDDPKNCTACGKKCPANFTCSKLGGGGCIERITVNTDGSGDGCEHICALFAKDGKCVEGAPGAVATYQGTATTWPTFCNTPAPGTVTESGITHKMTSFTCACLHPVP